MQPALVSTCQYTSTPSPRYRDLHSLIRFWLQLPNRFPSEAQACPSPQSRGLRIARSWLTTAPLAFFSLSPSNGNFASAEGFGSFTVNTGSGCNWSASSNASWITLLPGGSKGVGTVNF